MLDGKNARKLFVSFLALAILAVLGSAASAAAVRAPNPQDLQSDVLFYGELREDLSVSAVFEGNTDFPNLDRVYVSFDPNGYLLYDFGQTVTKVRVFPSIDHYDASRSGDSLSDGCGKEYSMFASPDLITFTEIFTATAITGSVDPLIYHSQDCSFTTQGSGTLITTYTDGWHLADPSVVADDYVADFDLNGAYRYIQIKCVPAGVADCDPEIDAIGALAREERPVVGGEILPIDMSAMLIAGAFTNAYWILPTIAGIAGFVVAITTRVRGNNNKNGSAQS